MLQHHTGKGFRLQQVVRQTPFQYREPDSPDTVTTIKADSPQKPYVFKAQMTLQVNLLGETATHEIESCAIDYGSEQMKKLLDARNLWEKFIDILKSAFGIQLGVEIDDLAQFDSGTNNTPLL